MTDENQMLGGALWWAGKGFAVHPLDPESKKPKLTNWPEKATTDEEQIREWWDRWPDANVGLALGEKSDAVAVDEDPRHGGDLDALGPLPETLVNRTGGGGRHAFFRYHEALERSRDIAPGVELKSNGAQVVAPPSVHPSGDQYEVEEDAPLAQPPSWLLNGAGGSERTDEGEGSGTPTRIQRLLREGVEEGGELGGRNEAISYIARYFARQGVAPDIATTILEDFAEKCRPPYPSDPAEKSVAETVRSNYRSEVGRGAAGEDRSDPTLFSWEDVKDRPNKISPLIPRFVWPERVTVMSGREKIGKSSLVAHLAARFTAGEPVLDREIPEDGSVLWVTERNEASREDPFLDLRYFDGDASRMRVMAEINWRDEPIAEVRRAAEMMRPDLLVVDSLSSILVSLDLDLGDDASWIGAIQQFQGIAKDFHCGVLLVHHARRSDGRYRGSGGIGQSADALLQMFNEEDRGLFERKIEPQGRRRLATLEVVPYRIQMTEDGRDYVYLGQIGGDDELEDRVRQYVKANDECGVREVRRNVSGDNTKISDILDEDPLIEHNGDGYVHRDQILAEELK